LVLDVPRGSKAMTSALADACGNVLRAAERDFRASLRKTTPRLSGRRRNFAARRYQLRLNQRGLNRINELLDQLAELGSEDDPGATTFSLTVALSPRP
jgi:hypothetical protein